MNENRRRAAMISYSFYHNDDRIRRHVANLVELGYNVDLICLRYRREDGGAPVAHVRFFFPRTRSYAPESPWRTVREYLLFGLQSGWIMLHTHLFEQRLAFVHVNNMPNFLVFAALPLRLLGVPVLLDVHDAMPENFEEKFRGRLGGRMRPLLLLEERWSMRFANYVICTEHTKFERLVRNGLARRKGAVVMNAADPRIWDRKRVGAHAREDGTFRLVYHGTLAQRLGLETAIQAVQGVVARIPGIRFDIIGDGDHRAALIRLVRDLNLEKHVFFSEGFVRVDKLPERLKDADVAVVPARDTIAFRYNLSGKLLEYVAFDIPCIATDTPTHTHYFCRDQMRFFHADDVAALQGHILDLHAHPEERRLLTVRARAFLARHDYDSECGTYKRVVRALVDGGRQELEAIATTRGSTAEPTGF